MKNHIKVLSRADFKRLFSEAKPEELTSYAIISIHEPIGANKMELFGGASDIILESSDNVLNLWFDDAETDIPLEHQLWRKFGVVNSASDDIHLFNEDMADEVVKFVEENRDAEYWVLHCTAGISRSGAVGSFLADYFEIDWFDFKRDNPKVQPNSLVRKILTSKLTKNL